MPVRTGYSGLQIGLHWIIALLIIAAYFTSEGMGDALERRIETGAAGIAGNTLHVWLGGAAFGLILIRIVVRLVRGAPGHSPDTPPMMALAATWVHRLLYLMMIVTPALGAAAWYGGVEVAAEIHESAGTILMLLAVAHVLGGIVHEALLRDGTMARMIRPAPHDR